MIGNRETRAHSRQSILSKVIIQVHTGKEIKYAEKFGSRAECPTRIVTRVQAGRTHEQQIAAMTGYVVAEMEADDPYMWHYAAGIEGFGRVLGSVRQKELDTHYAAIEKAADTKPKPFIPKPGQRVIITDGPFVGRIGLCVWSGQKHANLRLSHLNNLQGNLSIPTEACAPAPKDAVEAKTKTASRTVRRPRSGSRRRLFQKTLRS